MAENGAERVGDPESRRIAASPADSLNTGSSRRKDVRFFDRFVGRRSQDVPSNAEIEGKHETSDTVWNLVDNSEEELSWDPFGGLSETIAELPCYRSSSLSPLKMYSNAAQQRFRKRSSPKE